MLFWAVVLRWLYNATFIGIRRRLNSPGTKPRIGFFPILHVRRGVSKLTMNEDFIRLQQRKLMKIHFCNLMMLFVFVTLSACSVHAAGEQELIAILQSSAGAVEKCAACQQLRIYGTVQSVPALAALLGEERVGHAARYALEGIPGPEAVASLREALTKTSGLNKAGLINSLGWRRGAESVPLLVPLISDTETAIGQENASALGRIGSDESVAALKGERANSTPLVRRVP